MSIPPLVCSTPPPPEQCEDDKENEDYDFQYNLPPDEDDENQGYSFCHYTSPLNYHTEMKEEERVEIKTDNNEDISQINNSQIDTQSNTKDTVEIVTNPEENLVEDLNLKISAIDLQTSNNNSIKCENSDDDSSPVTSIQDQGGTNISNLEENNETCSVSINPDGAVIYDDLKVSENDIEANIENEIPEQLGFDEDISEPYESVVTKKSEFSGIDNDLATPKVLADDEFEDFDDFQCTSSDNATVLSKLEPANPWENDQFEGQDFGDFKANFDEPGVIASEIIESLDQANSIEPEKILGASKGMPDNLDDEFGDFDDFQSNKSNINETLEESISSQNVLNIPLSKSEEQIVDNVNSVLTTIFIEDISEPETKFDTKLESLLGETWGHLVDTDIRQPYMVHWNNSFGQKIMLKALCIDSRNILFGPKWNYNAPRFASNLGAAPLQPQKQLSSQQISEGVDKTTNQLPNTWTDPFTPQGQEYTYAEALLLDLEHLMATLDQMAHKHSTLKISELLSHACSAENEKPSSNITPKDLDTFTNEVPSSVTKIYSSTLSIQPLRQINLPDTHIFTPTDSETPRSKTIHYGSSPNKLVKSDLDVEKIDKIQTIETCKIDNSKDLTKNDNEYWDFQDFKQSSDVSTELKQTKSSNTKPENVTIPSGVYKTQILEPIKLEPTMPTLNWPDPGEVKETFYDFSDFVSNVSWNDKTTELVSDKDTHPQIPPLKDGKIAPLNNNVAENADDDFETFQSAPASISNVLPQTTAQTLNITEKLDIEGIHESKSSHLKSEKEIKLNSVSFSNPEIFQVDQNTSNNEVPKPVHLQPSRNSFELLKPSIPSSSVPRNQQKSAQILQPLSLESYSQINWPNPGIDLQDLSRFNPIESVHSLKSDTSTSGTSKVSTPVHTIVNNVNHDITDDDIWGDFVSSAPKSQTSPKSLPVLNDDDEWTDFVSSPNVKPPNGLNTISFNVQSNLSIQKSIHGKYSKNQNNIDIPALNYITPKCNNRGIYTDKHFQNL